VPNSRLLLFGTASLALYALAAQGSFPASAQAPRISKPRPAPNVAPNVPPLPPAVIDNSLAIGGQDLKARSSNTRLTVQVHVNGRGPYRFLVDSGADTSVVGLRIAHDLQLPLGTPAILHSTTARELVDRVKVAELTLGPTTVRDLQLPALAESDVGGEGLIGIDALVQQRLLMDFEKRLIKVEDARTYWKAEPGEIVIVAKRQRGQLILTQVRAQGHSLDAIIDTGSEVTIGNSALRDKLLRKGTEFWSVPATGVTGVTIPMQMAVVRELQLGPVSLYDVPVAFADVPPFKLFGISEEPALLLGTDLLSTFRRVSLDFRSRKVRFQLRRCGTDGVVFSTSPTSALSRLRGGVEACGR
jgi:predicted aspartyl protease